MAYLGFINENSEEVFIKLHNFRMQIGRDSSNNIVIKNHSVSKIHASLIPLDQIGGGYQIIDLLSVKGVYINGIKVTEHRLKYGDRITLGNIDLFYLENSKFEKDIIKNIEQNSTIDNKSQNYKYKQLKKITSNSRLVDLCNNISEDEQLNYIKNDDEIIEENKNGKLFDVKKIVTNLSDNDSSIDTIPIRNNNITDYYQDQNFAENETVDNSISDADSKQSLFDNKDFDNIDTEVNQLDKGLESDYINKTKENKLHKSKYHNITQTKASDSLENEVKLKNSLTNQIDELVKKKQKLENEIIKRKDFLYKAKKYENKYEQLIIESDNISNDNLRLLTQKKSIINTIEERKILLRKLEYDFENIKKYSESYEEKAQEVDELKLDITKLKKKRKELITVVNKLIKECYRHIEEKEIQQKQYLSTYKNSNYDLKNLKILNSRTKSNHSSDKIINEKENIKDTNSFNLDHQMTDGKSKSDKQNTIFEKLDQLNEKSQTLDFFYKELSLKRIALYLFILKKKKNIINDPREQIEFNSKIQSIKKKYVFEKNILLTKMKINDFNSLLISDLRDRYMKKLDDFFKNHNLSDTNDDNTAKLLKKLEFIEIYIKNIKLKLKKVDTKKNKYKDFISKKPFFVQNNYSLKPQSDLNYKDCKIDDNLYKKTFNNTVNSNIISKKTETFTEKFKNSLNKHKKKYNSPNSCRDINNINNQNKITDKSCNNNTDYRKSLVKNELDKISDYSMQKSTKFRDLIKNSSEELNNLLENLDENKSTEEFLLKKAFKDLVN